MPRNARTSLDTATSGERVDTTALAPDGSYGVPDFVMRGYYVDPPFVCQDCGKAEVWTATQQKWWYEVTKGSVWTTAHVGAVPVGSKSESVAMKLAVFISQV